MALATGPVGVPLDAEDHDLIAAAIALVRRHHKPVWHTVAAAIRSVDGRIWTGIHLGATVGRMSVCAEPIAFGRALIEGDGTAATIVAVRHPKPGEASAEIAVVAPCGACRELMMDHAPNARIIVPTPAGVVKMAVRDLLPLPYQR